MMLAACLWAASACLQDASACVQSKLLQHLFRMLH
jgi:hypothetical protein